ncbi:MAG: hypothetical protein K2M08_01710 [Anaeroplasmataceae bacterium]|nr:hypothetical protein [Anaeroplasmataceae bacterium]
MDVYTKIDLHIHSFASGKTKSGDIPFVKRSTIENVEVLVKKLNENNINMCAITDHNTFDEELYNELKKQENIGSIKKVLPGVELDLLIDNIPVHTICLFNDQDNSHSKKIKDNLCEQGSYTLSDLGKILSNIGLDVILIAHQKTDYKAKSQNSTNLSTTGIENFYRMIDVEYFDSLEVRSSKVEGILKSRFVEDKIKNQALISGSDCHDWEHYPQHDATSKEIPLLLSMKALPSFRGLSMAITNTKRFVVDVQDVRSAFIKSINYTINGQKEKIDLSYGINAIIGDNSVGKSTLIKSLFGIAPKEAIDFFSNHGINVSKDSILKSDYQFNEQGQIRKKFETTEAKLPIREDFKNQFKEIDISGYVRIINHILESFINLWNQNEQKHLIDNRLRTNLNISTYDRKNSYYLTFASDISSLENKFSGIIKDSSILKSNISDFGKKYGNSIDKEDLEKLREFYRFMVNFKSKYAYEELSVILKNKLINAFNSSKSYYIRETDKNKSTEESNYNTYLAKISDITDIFVAKIKNDAQKVIDPFDNFKSISLKPIDNQQGDYHFISKPIFSKEIDKKTIIDFIKNKIDIDVFKATKSEVLANIRTKTFNNKVCANLNELKSALVEEFKKEYFTTTVELKHGLDNLNEGNSAGINALYYLDILSLIFDKKVFIIDQPEDDVSQTKINSVLLNSLQNFSKRAQVIIITHNPQLVVNLDVDNVIVIKKDDSNDSIKLFSGPLELVNNEVDMLKLVANTLEGGIDVIKKRWKRYDKAN